ncbi:helix-turn-helix domain-containing protein [Streptomyces meridianus]|uniref:Helix-turn-helix domain-containing protein n=1 Tax=Streptomyces meridianus TaxID=2938945 RepID=A0ABT0WZV7_9ACTN|nr:helix-turn-helix transcriptional regulator [Streptomyces meridianus]MCM2575856.1 helix-turn-helix domain-containing protein [Streptomyces meridianus]
MDNEVGAEGYGSWLEQRLRQQGISTAELAKRLDVTPAAVSAWIGGRSEPRDAMKRAVANLLGGEPTPLASPVSWYHRPAHADGGREFGNAAAFAFDADVSVLAREATQNSLDERLDSARPVRVRYTLHELTGDHLNFFLRDLGWDDLEPHYRVAAEQKQKVGRVLAEALRELREIGSLLLLRVDDFNATGLIGGDYGDSKFAAVVRDQLNSNKSSNQAGGSYGLGKATLWATSRFGLVLINSTLSEPHEGRTERRLVGRLELPWHVLAEDEFAGPAWLGTGDPEREGIARSWWADEATAEALHLERDTSEPGTSFLIVGAHDAAGDTGNLQDMHRKLVSTLGQNFWAAMTSGRDRTPLLEASVVTMRNGIFVTDEERVDPHVEQPACARALRAYLDGDTVDQLTAAHQVALAHVTLRVPRLGTEPRTEGGAEHEAVLLVTPADDKDESSNRLVCMRGNRMTVMERAVRDLPLGTDPFQAVLLAGRATGRETRATGLAEAFLRAAEPPEHNDWNKTEELAATYARGALSRITEFRRDMDAAVRGIIGRRKAKRDGGPDVLRDLLRLDVANTSRRVNAHPSIRHVSASVDDSGAWQVQAEVKLPAREDAWTLEAVAKFDVRSGGRPRVPWARLAAGENCRVENGLLMFSPGARSASFTGVTDVTAHPVNAAMASLVVDLQKARESA